MTLHETLFYTQVYTQTDRHTHTDWHSHGYAKEKHYTTISVIGAKHRFIKYKHQQKIKLFIPATDITSHSPLVINCLGWGLF